jgi:hypothetical protein
MKLTFNPQKTMMVGRTLAGDPVWRTDKGPAFTIGSDDCKRRVRWPFRWPRKWGYRRLKAPHLNYLQVEVASEKSKAILAALRNGHLKEKKGFIYNRAGRMVMTKAMAGVVMHWMQACGIVLTRTPTAVGDFIIDLDVEATRKNGVT